MCIYHKIKFRTKFSTIGLIIFSLNHLVIIIKKCFKVFIQTLSSIHTRDPEKFNEIQSTSIP